MATLGEGSYGKVTREGRFAVKRVPGPLAFLGVKRAMQHARESKVLQRVLHQKGFTQLVAVEVHHPKVNHALQSIHEIPLDAGGFPDFGRLSLTLKQLYGGRSIDKLLDDPYHDGMPLHKIQVYARSACRALEHLHGDGIVHRDLKPANMLIDGNGECVLCDFGLSTAIHRRDGHTKMTPHWQTMQHAVCEVAGGSKEYCEKVDMWSLACVLFEMATGRLLFDAHKDWKGKPSTLSRSI